MYVCVEVKEAHENLENIVVPESPDNVIIRDNVFDDNAIVISQSDESIKTVSEHLEDQGSIEKDKDVDLNVIDVDNLNSRESPDEETPAEPKKKNLKKKKKFPLVTQILMRSNML
ncbi:hypothetical protein L195_g024331 [Trifolium pratense]|uniref:Uncharacterized protein n=1 Tax=Trifolium pratense TaxID=57577 RepID=A0A2K3NDD8_TRIPR|nr:hypothetical protein L195_g024331 [Trifolium pratense]